MFNIQLNVAHHNHPITNKYNNINTDKNAITPKHTQNPRQPRNILDTHQQKRIHTNQTHHTKKRIRQPHRNPTNHTLNHTLILQPTHRPLQHRPIHQRDLDLDFHGQPPTSN